MREVSSAARCRGQETLVLGVPKDPEGIFNLFLSYAFRRDVVSYHLRICTTCSHSVDVDVVGNSLACTMSGQPGPPAPGLEVVW